MQTSVLSAMAVGLSGQIADLSNSLIESFVNGSMQLDLITVTAANLATTLTIDGTAYTVNAGAATLTTIELAALMVTEINAASAGVTATDILDGTFHLRADVHGTGFTAVGTTNCTIGHLVLNEATIPFGKFVVRDTWSGLERSAHLPSLTAEITTLGTCLGVAVHSHANEQAVINADNPGYAAYSAMSIMRRGRIWVLVEDAVTVGGTPFVRFSADTTAGESLGSFRSDADTADAVALPHSLYETSADAGGIALLNLGGTVI